jgi:hypothetical protein
MGGDPVLIDLVLRNGRILRLPESVPPGRAAALADTLEACAVIALPGGTQVWLGTLADHGLRQIRKTGTISKLSQLHLPW